MLSLRRFPKSLLRLVLIGYAMVLVPLIVAGIYTAFQVRHLERDGVEAIDTTSTAVRHGLQMTERLLAMQRVLQQHQVLRDPALLNEYDGLRASWRQACEAFVRLGKLGRLGEEVSRLVALEENAYRGWLAGPEDDARAEALLQALAGAQRATRDLLARADGELDRLVVHYKDDARRLVDRLLLVLVMALPLSIAVVMVFRGTLRNLFVQFESAIASLGRGQMDHEIRLDGPADLQSLGRRLDWLRRRLIALESERNQFLRNTSHELKTPLAAVREGTHLLLDGVAGELNAAQRKIAGILSSNVRRLQDLIDDLLRLQQAAHDAERIRPARFSLSSLLEEVVAAHRWLGEPKRITLVGELGNVQMHGGADQLRIVFDNLVSNAVKYSPDGGKVTVRCQPVDDRVWIDVLDEGPGIAPQDRARIFEAFVRLPRTETIEGNGLGLAIAREYVSAHRGTIEVIESPRGAHFRVGLPLQWQREP